MRRFLLLSSLAIAGLSFYLWAATRAPVALWSDSVIDLKWANQGVGLWRPLASVDETNVHPVKPGYLLFLRAAEAVVPGVSQERSVVIVQSIFLWASIAASSLLVGEQRGLRVAIPLYVVLIAFTPLRNSASAIMSEAVSTSLLLPLVALAVRRPRRLWAPVGIGATTACLYLIRPNVGFIALLTLACGWLSLKAIRQSVILTVVFVTSVSAFVVAGCRTPSSAVANVMMFGSAEYYWSPSLGQWPAADLSLLTSPRLDRAINNWSRFLSVHTSDHNRELVWRSLHGLFGSEFYDSRWSPVYGLLDNAVRTAAPILILCALCLAFSRCISAPWLSACGAVLFIGVVAQSLLFGASPRLALPFLPALLLVGVWGGIGKRGANIAFGLMVGLGMIALVLESHILSWDFGVIERSGITITQQIPLGALPLKAPATLHIRVAAPLPGSADLLVRANGKPLVALPPLTHQLRPVMVISLPQFVLEENRTHVVNLCLSSTGTYGTSSYLIFPVIPFPWRSGAERKDSAFLSPTSGVRSGSLDWWAHRGTD